MKTWFLYHHIPKCGGRSFMRACSEWFHTEHEDWGSYPDKARVAELAGTRPDLEALPADTLLHGHYIYPGLRPHERYADVISQGRLRLITIVRDPLDRHISSYFHRAKRGRREPGETLEWWVNRSHNRIAKCLGVDEGNWRRRLDEYFLVGTTELLSLTIDLLAKKIGKPPVETPLLNTSPRDGERLSEEAAQRYRERNQLDYDIFHYATARLRSEAEAAGLVPSPVA
jgi:hypothetical protein